jgi:hypothetical protein
VAEASVQVYSDRHRALIQRSDFLLGQRGSLLSLWQCVADNFYPERADFTITRAIGDEFADHLTSSYPIIVRRDLGNSFTSMLRPSGQDWFQVSVGREDRLDNAGKAWLENASNVQRRAMYDRVAMFSRATKEADHDFAAFGQAALSEEINWRRPGLLYRTWHLRDMAWCDGADGQMDFITRRWKPTAIDLVRDFPKTVSTKVREMVEKDNGRRAYEDVNVRHVVVRAENYDGPYGGPKAKLPWVSIFIDCDNQTVLEEKPRRTSYYVIPRWQTVSGSQYAFSPATVAGLPDARLIQSMSYTLLTAGEKAANPPMIAKQEVVRSDMGVYSGGVTWIDAEYDERLGEALRPIASDYRGLPAGQGMLSDARALLETAFYLNRLTMPPPGPEMTATEATFRAEEYIRQAAPLFEPMEAEYNAPLCENTFDDLLYAGAFGSLEDIPESLRGADIKFKFEGPLIRAKDRELATTFVNSKALIAEAVQLDPAMAKIMNTEKALRSALKGGGTPSDWLKDEDEMAEISAQMAEREAAARQADFIGKGAAVVEQVGKAGQAVQQAEAA